MNDYITCSKCGITTRGHICPYRTYKKKDKNSKANKFRATNSWVKKREEIKTRDKYLCQVCINNLYSTMRMINYDRLEVHHIIPIEEDYNKRLDNDNLITLCSYHHHLAERGKIPVEELQNLIPPIK